MDDKLIFDILLISGGVRDPDFIYPPRDSTDLKRLLDAIDASNYDTLRFIGSDGRRYMWASHRRVSTLNGQRYDALRHALFVANEAVSPDPLYGLIVADHAFWDGHVEIGRAHV